MCLFHHLVGIPHLQIIKFHILAPPSTGHHRGLTLHGPPADEIAVAPPSRNGPLQGVGIITWDRAEEGIDLGDPGPEFPETRRNQLRLEPAKQEGGEMVNDSLF